MDNWYCPLPFRHAYIDPEGISCCCQTPRQKSTLADWPDNQWLKRIQSQTLQGEIPDECQSCRQNEKDFGHSLRTNSIRDYDSRMFTETQIDFIDYRSINICNFRCRSCNPVFSHGIDNEVKNNPVLLKYWNPNGSKTVSVDTVNRDWILENISSIRRLMFTGGEPTRIPEIKSIIETIASHDKLDLEMMITTNGSFEDQFWKEITKKIERLHWTLSLDAVNDAAEIVRYGTNWKVLDSNARWLAQHANSLNISTVITDISTPGLSNLLRYVRELQNSSNGHNGCRHQFHVCRRPELIAADNWPPELKSKILARLESVTDLLDYQQEFLNNFSSMLKNSQFDEALWNRSREFHSTLDSIRDQDHRSLLDI